eukprot:107074_1
MSVSDEEDVTTSMKNTFKSFNLKDKNKPIVTKIHGNGNIILDSNEVILKSISSFPTFKINIDLPQSGSYYYEIQIFTSLLMQLGWSDDDMIIKSSSHGVGDDNHSWGYDGYRKCSWNNGRQTYEGAKLWNINDYIGFGLDYDKKICEFFINGESMGIAFKNMNIKGNIYPTLTLNKENTIKILSINKIKYYNEQIKNKYKTVIDIANHINNIIKSDIIQIGIQVIETKDEDLRCYYFMIFLSLFFPILGLIICFCCPCWNNKRASPQQRKKADEWLLIAIGWGGLLWVLFFIVFIVLSIKAEGSDTDDVDTDTNYYGDTDY